MPGSTVELGVFVADVEAMTSFYVRALGFARAGEFQVPGASVRGLRLGGTTLKLVVLDAPVTTRNPAGTSLGFRYVTVAVGDAVAATARCLAAGAELVRPVTDFLVPGETTPRALTSIVLDPEGNRIELCQGSPWTPATSPTGDGS